MARKARRVCLVSAWWTPSEIQSRTCGDDSHGHISQFDAKQLLDAKEAEWMVVDKVLRLKNVRKNLRDKSCKFGDYLAKRIRQRKPWALVMEANIRGNFQSLEKDEA